MNMYTAPAYRRQGIAFHTLDLLVKVIRKQGVSQITLEATEMGRPLYEKYGFVKMEEGKKDSVVPYIIELDFESSCNEMESECPIYSFKLIAKQEHCYIEKEFKGK